MNTADRDPATLFLRNRHLLWMSVAILLVAGVASLAALPRLEDPRIDNRGAVVVTPFPGASAERVESLVTEVLEDALDEIDGIKDVDSTSRAGTSTISIELDDMVTSETSGEIVSEIRDRISQAAALLPPEAGEPVVDDTREAVAFTLVLGLTWTRPEPPAMGVLDRLAVDLADRLRTLPGTELVRVYGAPEEEILVALRLQEAAELGMGAAEVAARIAAADARRPAGALRTGTSARPIEVAGSLDAVARVASAPLATGRGGAILAVGDVAEVSRSWRMPPEEIALIDGRRSVLVAARVASDIRVDVWAATAAGIVAEVERDLVPGIAIERVFEQERYTTRRLRELAGTLVAGAVVIAAAVLLVMGLGPAIVVATALPLTVCAVLAGWQLGGGAIHQMSVFGLIIALGLLIDNAIVVTDEVVGGRRRGLGPADAVREAVRHLAVPLGASTLTTVLAFAPITLLPGSAGDFVGSIGSSVIMAIVASLAIALTIIAALAGLFLRPAGAAGGAPRRWWRDGISQRSLARPTAALLERLYRVPVVPIALALVLPLAGFAVAPSLGKQFFPPVDRDMLEIRLWMPGDASIEATRAEAERVEATLRGLDGVRGVAWLVGGSFPSVWYNLIMNQDGAAGYAHGVVFTDSPAATKRLLETAQLAVDERHPAAQVLVRQFAQGPPVVADVEFRVLGRDTAATQAVGERLRARLQEHPDVVLTQASMDRGTPKLLLQVDESDARLAGLALADVADRLEATLEGRTGGRVLEGLEQMPVRVRAADAVRGDLDAVATLPLATPGGGWTPLAALGTPTWRPELPVITRAGGERTNTISAFVRTGALPIDIAAEVLADLEASGIELPPGVRLELGGASEQDAEATGNLAVHAPILGTMMVATLVLAFGSVRLALLLGVVTACSLGLALLSTWSIDFPVSFNTILGTLGLVGVALNDSIVVIASVRADPRAAAGDPAALAKAVMGCLRHVVATTLTTIGGFLPLLLFVGGDFWPSLAIVLVGGIGGATLVAVLLVPAAMRMMGDVGGGGGGGGGEPDRDGLNPAPAAPPR